MPPAGRAAGRFENYYYQLIIQLQLARGRVQPLTCELAGQNWSANLIGKIGIELTDTDVSTVSAHIYHVLPPLLGAAKQSTAWCWGLGAAGRGNGLKASRVVVGLHFDLQGPI